MYDIKEMATIISVFIGILGLVYGLYKDRQIRNIENKSKAPHFIPQYLMIDAFCLSKPDRGKPYYSYREEATNIDGRLFAMESYQTHTPEDYPDNRVVSLLAKNCGSKIRFFSVKSQDVFFKKHEIDDYFEFRYFLRKEEIGKYISIKLIYETEAGIQGTQVWSLAKGDISLTRLKPKAV
jgi:hypothetical protein